MKFLWLSALFSLLPLLVEAQILKNLIPPDYKLCVTSDLGSKANITHKKLHFHHKDSLISLNLGDSSTTKYLLKHSESPKIFNDTGELYLFYKEEKILYNVRTTKERQIKYDKIKPLNEQYIGCKNFEIDTIYIVKYNDPDFLLTLKGCCVEGIFCTKDMMLIHEYKNKISSIYNFKGERLFSAENSTLSVLSYEHNLFKIRNEDNHNYSIIKINGKTIEIIPQIDIMDIEDVGVALELRDYHDKYSYLDYEVKPILDTLLIPIGNNKIFRIGNCDKKLFGLFFSESNITTPCKFDNILQSEGSVFLGRRFVVEAKKHLRNSYYDQYGNLLFDAKKYVWSNYLRNNYIAVCNYDSCGIVNSLDETVVDFNVRRKKDNFIPYYAGTIRYNGIDFFYVLNNNSNIEITNNKNDDLILLNEMKFSAHIEIGQNFLATNQIYSDNWGVYSIENGQLIIPFDYFKIYVNSFREVENREYVILHKGNYSNASYSLYHVPTKKYILEDYSKLHFKNTHYISYEKDGYSGVFYYE